MRTLRDLALFAVAGCEATSAVALLRGYGLGAFFIHVAACGCAAALLHRRALAGPAPWSFALIFASTLFVPFLGLLGAIAVALVTPSAAAGREPACVRTRIPRPSPAVAPRCPSQVSRLSNPRRARIEALTALRNRSDPEAVVLLRRALADSDEDVRLLAHALLESKNRTACRGIDDASRELEGAPEEQRGAIHRRLASRYWELAWLGLVHGECLDHALATARGHALAALERNPQSASIHFLLGRIELRLGAGERAELALIRARELGLPRGVVAPYLAEAAFLRRRFDRVRSYLAEPGAAQPSGAAARVRRYWT